jgi:hypothetical protein
MTRSWVAFAAGLLLTATPLRRVWAQPELGPWALFAVAFGLVILGVWVAKGRGP